MLKDTIFEAMIGEFEVVRGKSGVDKMLSTFVVLSCVDVDVSCGVGVDVNVGS